MKLMKCQVCGEYTLKQTHHDKQTKTAHPISSGVSKYVEQRVKMRSQSSDREE